MTCDPTARTSRSSRNSRRAVFAPIRGVVWAGTLALALACGGRESSAPQAEAAAPPRPDVFVVVIDALRSDRLGAYGYNSPEPTSPFLDSLAAEGWLYESAYSQASQTFNSTASLFTSRYFPYRSAATPPEELEMLPDTIRQQHSRIQGLLPANLFLSEVLQDNGYETAAFFDNPHHHPKSGFWQGFDYAEYLDGGRRRAYAPASDVHAAITGWLETRQSEEPYFAYVHFMDVHSPYRPPKYLEKLFVTGSGRDLYVNGVPEEEPTEADIRYMSQMYDASIRFVDEVLADLWNVLEERYPDRERLVLVTSDHGDEFFEHGGFGHGHTVEPELLRIPMIVHGAGVEPAPERIKFGARLLDVAPTLLDLLKLPLPEDFEGQSLRPSEQTRGSFESLAWVGGWRSLTTDRWHFALHDEGEARLYDLSKDPLGTQDLTAERPEIVEQMTARLEHWRKEQRRTRKRANQLADESPEDQTPDQEIVDQLEALGYLN